MKIEHKVVPVTETKVIDEEQGIVGAFVSVTGVVDSVKDRIIPGAYQSTLVARTPKGVWSHDWDSPVSKTLQAEELLPGDDRLPAKTRDGQEWPAMAGALYVETQFNLKTQRGREAFEDVKFYGPDQEWSIGYNVPPGASKMDGKTGVRELSYIDLYEYSPVLFGAMPLTSTAGFKDAQKAFKDAVEAGDATPDMVVEEERTEAPEVTAADISMGDVVVVPAGTLREDASRMLLDAMAGKAAEKAEDDTVSLTPVAQGFTEATENTPVTTPADRIHQVTPGHTGDQAGVEVEPRPDPQALVDPDPAAEAPKAAHALEGIDPAAWAKAEFVVSINEKGRAALDALAESLAYSAISVAEYVAKASEVLADRSNLDVKAQDVDTEAKAMVTLTGSYEERQQALRRQAATVTDGFDLEQTDEWGYPRYYLGVEATFNNRVVYAAYDMGGDDPVRYFEASYAYDGQQATLKNPREVRVEAAVVAKVGRQAEDLKRVYADFRAKSRRITEGLDMPGLAPAEAVEATLEATKPEAKGEDPPEGEATAVTLSEADLLMLERLKLDA